MIPKRVITCWFGPKTNKRKDIEEVCLASIKEQFKDYDFLEVNEKNFPIEQFKYAKMSYERGYYAFVADVARLWALYYYGGIYFDTDVLILKNFDEELLKNEAFIGSCMNEETLEKTDELISAGIIGAEKGSKYILNVLNRFAQKEIYDMQESSLLFMKSLKEEAVRCSNFSKEDFILKEPTKVRHLTIYPYDYFTCCFWRSKELVLTENSYAVHLYAGAWTDKKYEEKVKNRIFKMFDKIKETKDGRNI